MGSPLLCSEEGGISIPQANTSQYQWFTVIKKRLLVLTCLLPTLFFANDYKLDIQRVNSVVLDRVQT